MPTKVLVVNLVIIGDVHGNFNTLMALLDKIPESEKQKGICFVGDLMDRGAYSMQVIDWIINTQQYKKVDCVMANHEKLMLDNAMDSVNHYIQCGVHLRGRISTPNLWTLNGGDKTIESYQQPNGDHTTVDIKKLKKHLNWMKTLPIYKEYKDIKNDEGKHLLVTHSSATSVWKWSKERRETNYKQFEAHLLWGRPNQIHPIKNIYNVFGHTPVENGPKIKSHYANIDTGCFFNDPGYFRLTALQFPEMIVYTQECIDKPIYKME